MTTSTQRAVATKHLRELADIIAQGPNLEETLNYVYSAFSDFLPYDRIGYADISECGELATSRWARSSSILHLKPGHTARISRSSLALVVAHKTPRILNDLPQYLENRPKSKSTELMVREGIRSSVTCPLFVAGYPTGILFFSSRELHTYEDQHSQLLKEITGQLAVALLAKPSESVVKTNARWLMVKRVKMRRLVQRLRQLNDGTSVNEVRTVKCHAWEHPIGPQSRRPHQSNRCLVLPQLEPGMTISRSVIRSDGMLLLREGTQLTSEWITRLTELEAEDRIAVTNYEVRVDH